jgi:hypothetical protein
MAGIGDLRSGRRTKVERRVKGTSSAFSEDSLRFQLFRESEYCHQDALQKFVLGGVAISVGVGSTYKATSICAREKPLQ